jgi:hypothetical protein
MPQPIDMQTELARTTLANRIQQVTERATHLAAIRAVAANDEEQILGETQVDESPDAQSEHVDPETKRRNPFVRTRHAKRDSGESHESKPRDRRADSGDHHFDVSV